MDVEDVTLGEIVRALGDLREEIRALRGEHVRRDLYEAHRAAFAADLARLNKQVESQEGERKSRHWAINLAMIGAGLSLLVQLIVAVAH